MRFLSEILGIRSRVRSSEQGWTQKVWRYSFGLFDLVRHFLDREGFSMPQLVHGQNHAVKLMVVEGNRRLTAARFFADGEVICCVPAAIFSDESKLLQFCACQAMVTCRIPWFE